MTTPRESERFGGLPDSSVRRPPRPSARPCADSLPRSAPVAGILAALSGLLPFEEGYVAFWFASEIFHPDTDMWEFEEGPPARWARR